MGSQVWVSTIGLAVCTALARFMLNPSSLRWLQTLLHGRPDVAQQQFHDLAALLQKACTRFSSLADCIQSASVQEQVQALTVATKPPGPTLLTVFGHASASGVLMFVACAVLYIGRWGLDRSPAFVKNSISTLLHTHPDLRNTVQTTSLIAYKLDQWYSTSPYSKLLLLFFLTISLIATGSFGLYAVGSMGIWEAFWAAVAGAGLDWTGSNTISSDHEIIVRVVGLFISIGGMLITALLLGIVSDALGKKVDELRKGKSAVLESGHCVILGWSEKIFCLIEQLAMGMEHSGGRPIVVMSDLDKEVMEEHIQRHNIELRNSSIICRHGDPLIMQELGKVSIEHASSIVILGDHGHPEASDARTLRIVLSLMAFKKMGCSLNGHILAEVCHSDHESLLHTLAGGPQVRTVVSREMIGRLMVQSARWPQLTHVLQEILGFDGNEFYFVGAEEVLGRRFESLQAVFPTAVPMGIRQGLTGKIMLNPPGNTVVDPGDEIIVLAEDETQCNPDLSLQPETNIPQSPRQTPSFHRLAGQGGMDAEEECTSPSATEPDSPTVISIAGAAKATSTANSWMKSMRSRLLQKQQASAAMSGSGSHQGGATFGGRFLFCGWRQDIGTLIHVLDEFATLDSELWLYNDIPLEQRRLKLQQGGLDMGSDPLAAGLNRIRLVYNDPRLVGSNQKRHLQLLFPLQFNAILILAEEPTHSGKSMAEMDSQSLAILMLLRQIQVEDLRSGRLEPPDDEQAIGGRPLAAGAAAAAVGAASKAACQDTPSEPPSERLSAWPGLNLKAQPKSSSIKRRLAEKAAAYESPALSVASATTDIVCTPATTIARCNSFPEVPLSGIMEPPGAEWTQADRPSQQTYVMQQAPSTALKRPTIKNILKSGFKKAVKMSKNTFPAIRELASANNSRTTEEVPQGTNASASLSVLGAGVDTYSAITAQRQSLRSDGGSDEHAQPAALHAPAPATRFAKTASLATSRIATVGRATPSRIQPLQSGRTSFELCSSASPTRPASAHRTPPMPPGSAVSGHARPSLQTMVGNSIGSRHSDSERGSGGGSSSSSSSRGSRGSKSSCDYSNLMVLETMDELGNTGPRRSSAGWSSAGEYPCTPDNLPEASTNAAAQAVNEAAEATSDRTSLDKPGLSPVCSSNGRETLAPQVRELRPGWSLQHKSMPGASTLPLPSRMSSLANRSGLVSSSGAESSASVLLSAKLPLLSRMVSTHRASMEGSQLGAPSNVRSIVRTKFATSSEAKQDDNSLLAAIDNLTGSSTKGPKGKGRAGTKVRRGSSMYFDELKQAVEHTVIISEILDPKTHGLVRDMHISKYIKSNELISQLLALISLCPERADVFTELFSPGGNELYTRAPRLLLSKDEQLSFYDLAARASKLGEILLGFITREGKTVLNPTNKSAKTLSKNNLEGLVVIAWS